MKSFIYLIILLFAFEVKAQQEEKIPIIRSNTDRISYRVDKVMNKGAWTVSPKLKPDIYTANIKDKPVRVTFITDIDSITFKVKAGKSYPFIVLLKGRDSAFTEVRGKTFRKAAIFTDKYKKEHAGNTYTEVPEVYELVNIMLSITPTLSKDEGTVAKGTNYYTDVVNHFMPFSDLSEIKLMDSLMTKNQYFQIKMDSYAFEFDKKGRIVRSKIYDRLSWGSDNQLLSYINTVQTFSDKTNFRDFYAKHQNVYQDQIAAYRDTINTAEMISWLRKNFPSSDYNSFKIIWSPLVGGNQSANWFADNGFKEMQAHVNFPYFNNFNANETSPRSIEIRRGDIVFTEINHSFINPEADKAANLEKISAAFKDLNVWEDGLALKYYGNAYSGFNEYMNWALVSLRYLDYIPKEDFEKFKTTIEERQVKRRGFKRFKEFNTYLVNLYRDRKPNTSIADLYPQILDWFLKGSENFK